MNYPPNHYSLPKMFTNVEKHLGKYDEYLFEKLITIVKLNLINLSEMIFLTEIVIKRK